MRFLRVFVPALLVISLAANLFMWLRWRKTRPIMTVNGQVVSEKDVVDHLEQEKGPVVKKDLVERILIDQQARKYRLVPSPDEVEAEFRDRRELSADFALQLATSPWFEGESKERIRMDLEQQQLRARDVQVTDDDIKDEYNRNPLAYDTPDRAHANLALIKDANIVPQIKQLLEKAVSPVEIQRNFAGSVIFPGYKQVYTFQRVFGTDPHAIVFNMKPNAVNQLSVTAQQQQKGIQGILVRLIEIVPGHKYDPNDARMKERIRLAVAAKRMKPFEEWLSSVWAETAFTSETEGDKQYIEALMFPDRTH